MRVAALAFGVLAGLVASFVLALGGLDVAAATLDRQAQAIRFGLSVIGNLGFFGAALALTAPLAGAVFLVLGAVAWAIAALVLRQATDLVLITPPALLLIAAVFAAIAHFRRPRPAVDDDESEVEIMAPERGGRAEEAEESEEDIGMPAFAAEQRTEPSVRGAFDEGRNRPQNEDWNPRRRQPPPPRTKPDFRPVEEEYEDEEPSGLSRFALGLSGVLSFGLYAALAGAGVLVVWSMSNNPPPAVTVAESPAVSSPVEAAVASSALPSAEETLQPILTGEPIRELDTAATAPSTSPSELVAATAPSQEAGGFSVTMSEGGIPTLSNDFSDADGGAQLPAITASPPSLPAEDLSSEPPAVAAATAPVQPSVAAPGQPLPRSVPLNLAAARTGPGTGPTQATTPVANATNTGL